MNFKENAYYKHADGRMIKVMGGAVTPFSQGEIKKHLDAGLQGVEIPGPIDIDVLAMIKTKDGNVSMETLRDSTFAEWSEVTEADWNSPAV